MCVLRSNITFDVDVFLPFTITIIMKERDIISFSWKQKRKILRKREKEEENLKKIPKS